MIVPYLDLQLQYQNIKSDIDEAIQRVIQNCSFIGGAEVQAFKKKFAATYGADHVIPVANGTDALYIALKMFDIGPGDEVITTATSWISTSETITQAGATPVFIDIDDYYTIDVSKIEQAITSKTKAIIPVHLYGQMCDMASLKKIAQNHGLQIIEDCAQSHFSKFNGTNAGLLGDCGTFSFYPGKNLGAFGDAGAIITSNPDFAERCQMFANHGALIKHNHLMEGINSRMDGLQAAILSVKLDSIVSWTAQRQKVAEHYTERLAELPDIRTPQIRPSSQHSFHVYAIRTSRRDELAKHLKKAGVSTQIHYPFAMPFMAAYDHHFQDKTLFNSAKQHQESELSLPIFPEITTSQVDYVCDSIADFCE